MLKILHLDTELTWRGGERQISLLCHGLKNHGHECYLGTPRDSALRAKLSLQSLDLDRGSLKFYANIKKIIHFVKEHQIDILDAHTSKTHSLALMVKKKLPSLKLVVHRRVDFLPSKGLISRLKYQNQGVDHYVAISKAIALGLTDWGVAKDKVSVVHSAVPEIQASKGQMNTAKARLCFAENWPVDLPIIGNIGYLTPQKDHLTFLAGLAELKKSNTPFRAFIAGDGELLGKVQAQKKALGLEELSLLGVRNDPIELLKACDILAMPSRFEGLGTTILDALQLAKPVAATAVGGIPEMVIHEQTGLLCPVGDGKMHGQQLERLIKNPNLRHRLGQSGQKLVKEGFSVDSMVAGNAAVYQAVLSGKVPSL